MPRVALIALLCATACGRIGYSSQSNAAVDSGAPSDSGGRADAGAVADSGPRADATRSNDAGCPVEDPFVLSPADTSALASAVDAFNAACPDYCAMYEVVGFTHPECTDPNQPIAEVIDSVVAELELQIRPEFPFGQLVEPADVLTTRPLGISPEGSALMDEIAALVGGSPSDVWYYEEQIPCPNCTQYETLTILWYRDARWLVALYGGHGYDS